MRWLLLAICLLFPQALYAQSPIAGFPPGAFQDRAALDASGGGTCSHSSQTFTATGAATFSVPANCTSLTEEAWGAGSGGSGSSSSTAPGGCGGGYSYYVATVTPAQTVYYNVGAGSVGASTESAAAGDSWVNAAANAEPSSNGVIGGGAPGSPATSNCVTTGQGSIGSTNFNGGGTQSGGGAGPSGGGGGGGAGSAGDGSDGVSGLLGGAGGAGGTPDGGAGGAGQSGTGSNGVAPGGAGGGSWSGTSGAGANGQVRLTW